MFTALSFNKDKTHLPETLAAARKDCTATELIYAVHNHQLILQYQPRYDSKSGQIVMLEALVRWQHPTQGLLPPDRFISIAEEHQLICDFGLWVFEQSCKDRPMFY